MRVGIGYDIHKLVKGRRLVLGGVEILFAKGLLGHSDADVLLHAICDALLGAIGEGDIGEYFPDTDPKYKDIDSSRLLEKVVGLVETKGYTINNIDSIVIAQEPKLGQHKEKIRETISGILKIDGARVNIKAKTNEGLGDIGKARAIAAYAVATVNKK